MTAPVQAADILRTAADLVSGDRNETHGDARENLSNIADLWNAYLGSKPDFIVSGRDVAVMMSLLKVARTTTGTHNPDDYIDICGYAALAGMVAK